jgi:hypothetical protein
MQLNGLFDVLRGWPREGALDESFPVHKTAGVLDTVVPGNVVYVNASGEVELASTGDRTTVDATPTWVIVEGTDDFSGQFVEKAVCLRSNAMFRLDPANFAVGTYAVGTLLSFSAGKWQEAAITEQVIGEVIANNTAIDGTIVVYYSGDLGAKLT